MVWEGRTRVSARVSSRRGLVRLGDSTVPPKATMTFEGVKGSPDATVVFEVRNGRPECVSITVRAKKNGRGIATSDLSLIRVDDLTVDIFTTAGNFGVQDEARQRQTHRDVYEARLSRRSPVSRDELKQVAKVYREHLDGSPTRTVGHVLGYSARTAARRVEQARAAGLLPPTTPGKRKA